ncbi:MAG: M20/M25/M40 family metallo-hydrolase [Anaerolineae bacterium]
MRNELKRLTAQSDVTALMASLEAEDVLAQAIRVQQIPAPTFHEHERANYILGQLGGRNLADVGTDALCNVYARLPGTDPGRPALLVSAHTDTVFAHDTDLTVTDQDGRVYGPGISDNSLGVASMLALLAAMERARYQPPCDVWFVANSREEGLGDLGGMRAVLERLQGRLGAALVIEGLGLGRVCYGGVAVRRLKLTCRGPGGHSWMQDRPPSAIHELMRLGARLADLTPPEPPRTTFNIGLIEGGTSINTIAAEASLYLDLRSESQEALATLEREVRALVEAAHVDGATFEVTLVGERPGGQLPIDHWLVRGAGLVLEMVGVAPNYNMASTDANAVLAAGVPGVTLGITHGGNAHRLDEYLEVAPIARGMRQLVLIALFALQRLAVV